MFRAILIILMLVPTASQAQELCRSDFQYGYDRAWNLGVYGVATVINAFDTITANREDGFTKGFLKSHLRKSCESAKPTQVSAVERKVNRSPAIDPSTLSLEEQLLGWNAVRSYQQ